MKREYIEYDLNLNKLELNDVIFDLSWPTFKEFIETFKSLPYLEIYLSEYMDYSDIYSFIKSVEYRLKGYKEK